MHYSENVMKFLDCGSEHYRDCMKLVLRLMPETHTVYDCDSIFYYNFTISSPTNIYKSKYLWRYFCHSLEKTKEKKKACLWFRRTRLASDWYISPSKFLSTWFMCLSMKTNIYILLLWNLLRVLAKIHVSLKAVQCALLRIEFLKRH